MSPLVTGGLAQLKETLLTMEWRGQTQGKTVTSTQCQKSFKVSGIKALKMSCVVCDLIFHIAI